MNSASRISEILKVAQAQAPNLTVGVAWANTFKVPQSKDTLETYMETWNYLSLLNAEFKLLEGYVHQDKSLDPKLTQSGLGVVKALLASIKKLDSQWEPFKNKIQDHTFVVLGWISRDLEKTEIREEEISGDELNNLINEISDLEKILEESKLSQPVRQVILHHMEIVRRAISNYPIIGASAFKDAVVNVCGEIILNGEFPGELNEKDNIKVRDRFTNILRRSWSNMEKAPKAYAVIKITEEVVSGLIKLIAP